MKRIVLLIFGLMGLLSGIRAQTITISSCSRVELAPSEAIAPRYDINGNLCAIVRVITHQMDGKMDFKGNIMGDYARQGSTYTLYVLEKTKRIRMYHHDHLPKVVDFTEYEDTRNGLEGGKVYVLHIRGIVKQQQSKANKPSGSRLLLFSSDTPIESLKVNGITWELSGNSAKRLLPYGEYEYEAISKTQLRATGIVELTPALGSKTVKIVFN